MTNEDVSQQNSSISQSQKLLTTTDKTNLNNEHILSIIYKYIKKSLATSFQSEKLQYPPPPPPPPLQY
jgi:hypothetical protein